MKIAASEFPADTEVTIKVFAYNDGSFTGLADPASRMNIRGEGPSNAVITRGVTPLHIVGNMGAQVQNVAVSRAGQAVTDAAVTVNGVAIPHASGGSYQGELPAIVPAGSPLDLVVTAGGVTVQATGNVPEAPVLTAPATGTVFALADSITVTWTSATDPDLFGVSFGSVFPALFATPGTARELRVAASEIGTGTEVPIQVSAFNDGTFTGPADPESRMNILVEASTSAVITITP
jgi:hypothetical protein